MKNLKLILLAIFGMILLNSCKKDKIEVNETKIYEQMHNKMTSDTTPDYISTWQVTLNPDGSGNVVPGGDIVYPGRYEIKGSLLRVKSGNETFEFDILSDTEIKEKKYGALLQLQQK